MASSTPIFPAPNPNGASTSATVSSLAKIDPAAIFIRFKQFGIHAVIVFAVVALYGCISASLITFFHPGVNTDAKQDEALKNKTKIFDRLDLLFPDDLEFSPYGFDITRGMVDTEKKTADADDKVKEAAKVKVDTAYAEDADKEHYTKFLGLLVPYIEIGGPFFKNPNDKPKTSSRPYSFLDVELIDGGANGKQTKLDGKTVDEQSAEVGGFLKIAAIWSKEIIGCALYFSYGRGRYYLKQFFGLIQSLMKKATPRVNATDDRPDYTYITNIMCLLSVFILAIMILIMIFWPGVSLIAGVIKNVYTKNNGVINNDSVTHEFSFIATKIVLLFLLSFVLFLVGAVNYIVQPIQVFGAILFYPISYSIAEWKKIILEIVPTLMGIFVFTMIIVSMYDLDQNVAIPISILMVITYVVIFMDKFEHLGEFISKIKTGILGFYNDPEKKDEMKNNKPKSWKERTGLSMVPAPDKAPKLLAVVAAAAAAPPTAHPTATAR